MGQSQIIQWCSELTQAIKKPLYTGSKFCRDYPERTMNLSEKLNLPASFTKTKCEIIRQDIFMSNPT